MNKYADLYKDVCTKCRTRPALTKCIRGNFCNICGQTCHGLFQHPVQFIIHESRADGLKKQKTVKSMSTLTKDSMRPTPLRLSKVESRIRMGRMQKQIQGHIQKDKKALVISNVKRVIKPLQLKIGDISRQNVKIKKPELHSKENSRFEVNFQANKQEELMILRVKLAEQADLIDFMKKKLEREKKKNRDIQIEYEEKLKIIRNMRN